MSGIMNVLVKAIVGAFEVVGSLVGESLLEISLVLVASFLEEFLKIFLRFSPSLTVSFVWLLIGESGRVIFLGTFQEELRVILEVVRGG